MMVIDTECPVPPRYGTVMLTLADSVVELSVTVVVVTVTDELEIVTTTFAVGVGPTSAMV